MSQHLGRPWNSERWTDLAGRSSHPAGVFEGSRFAVFAKFLKTNGLHNVFRHGDGGAAFDARMSGVELPPAIVSGMKLRQRLPWVREHVASVTGRAPDSAKRLAV